MTQLLKDVHPNEQNKVEGKEYKVCKLIKALYGLKQEPRAWYAKIDEYLRHVGFHRSESDDTLYFRM